VGLPALDAIEYVQGDNWLGVQAMNTTWYEKGIEKGMEKGIEKERRNSLRELLEERFGPLAPGFLARLEELPVENLQPLRRAALKAQSLDELDLQA
jgi:hypothetical protein